MMGAPSLRYRLLMFDFLFKRATKPAVTSPPPATQSTTSASHVARDAARAQAEKMAGDEAACADFLLVCEFADARLIAAQSIHSAEALQRVLKAVRNSDRRVARLMQSRLDALQTQNKVAELAARCVGDATSLTTQAHLTAQKVGDIDRRWSALVAPPSALQDAFNAARSMLGERLVKQAELQRKLIDTLASLRKLSDRTGQHSAHDLHTALERHDADIAVFMASAEAGNVPKNLFDQCKVAADASREVLTAVRQHEQQIIALVTMLEQWESVPAASLDVAVVQREWQRAIGSIDVLPEMQARLAALLSSVVASQPVSVKVKAVAASRDAATTGAVADAHEQTFNTALQALDEALTQGSLQHAQDADRHLRAIAAVTPTTAQAARLSRLRAQLGQMQSWARWGGNISREELQKAAIALPEQALPVVELAKKIGNLRQQWKALDATSGAASKEVWLHFDAACTTAYAPVAERHRVLDETRRANSEAAQQQITAVEQVADQLAVQEQPDWKTIAQYCQRAQQQWQRIGPTERRDKQVLDRRFQTALQRLLQPLGAMQKVEQALREQLIESALALNARASGTLESIRTLQQQWQLRATAVPLDRRTEQALWLRFRAACDAVFAQRKEGAAAEDQQRQGNLRSREALCLALEQTEGQPITTLTALLRDSAAAWSACGPVPRAAEDAIEKRYRLAVGVIKTQIDALQRGLADAQKEALRQKLQLCVRLDTALADPTVMSDDLVGQLAGEWERLVSISTRLDVPMTNRFEQGLQAHRASDHGYTEKLIANEVTVQNELLRLEIVLSLDSPPQLARERLKLQVEVLQAALREGQTAGSNVSKLATLCALPAAIDAETAARLEQVIALVVS